MPLAIQKQFSQNFEIVTPRDIRLRRVLDASNVVVKSKFPQPVNSIYLISTELQKEVEK